MAVGTTTSNNTNSTSSSHDGNDVIDHHHHNNTDNDDQHNSEPNRNQQHYKDDDKVPVLLYCNPLERTTWIRTGFVLFIIFILSLGLSYYLIGPGKNDNNTEEDASTNNDITTEQMVYYQNRFVTIRPILLQYTDLSDFIVPMSPQSKALQWILYKDTVIELQEVQIITNGTNRTSTTTGGSTTVPKYTLDDTSLHRLIQRYAVMVLYYALDGDSWQRSSRSSSSSSSAGDGLILPIQTIVPVLQTNDSIPLTIQINGYDTAMINQSECIMEGIICDDNTNNNTNEEGENTTTGTSTNSNIIGINIQGFGATGKIPSEIGLLKQLTILNLANNLLDGTIPSSIFNQLTNLEIIKLDQNEISSTIPSSIGMLTKLKNFSIGYNQLYGNLTTSFGNITTLELFNIENNVNITGYNVLDIILKNKTMLQHINIDSTQLSGTIPYNLTKYIPSLRTLTMDDTLITGPMPNLNSLQQLRRLIIVNDDMYGPIPELRLLTNLEYVHFQGGDIDGTISSSGIDKLQNLRELRIISTNVNGTIPTDIGRISTLTNLIIFENRFITGSIPFEIGNLPNLRQVEIFENDNNGTFPDGLCNKRQISVKRPCNVLSSKCNSICI